MATKAIGHQGIVVATKGENRFWETFKEFVENIAYQLEPFLGPMSLDFLDSHGQSKISPKERSFLDSDLKA